MDTNFQKLVEMKTAIILFHGTVENDEYLLNQIAKDACYTSLRAIEWKEKWWEDKCNEIDAILLEKADAKSDVTANALEMQAQSKAEMLERVRDSFVEELGQLKTRHKADLAAYEIIFGMPWMKNERKPARKVTKNLANDLRKAIA